MKGIIIFFEDLLGLGIFKKSILSIEPATAMLLSGAISGGLGLLGGFLGGDDEELQTFMPRTEFRTPPAAQWRGAPTPEQYAEFPESERARQMWMGRLQEWGAQPGYGAIAPDWGDIWEQAQQRVKQYYWGGPGGQPGLAGKVRASAARRGVAQSPALETELGRMGMQEAGDIGDIATQQAIQRAQFGEAGRQTWMQQLMGMTGVRPQYYQPAGVWQQPHVVTEQAMGSGAPQPGIGPLIGELGGALGGAGMQYAQQKWLQDLLKGAGGGGGIQGGVGGMTQNVPDYGLTWSPYMMS